MNGATSSLFGYANQNPDLQKYYLWWTIPLVNENISFFNYKTAFSPLSEITKDLFVPKNTNDIMNILKTSASFFGYKQSLIHLIKTLGGLSVDFVNAFSDSIDETKHIFSYSKFNDILRQKVNIFNLLINISTNEAAALKLKELSIFVEIKVGDEDYTTISRLSNIINYINNIYLAILQSQQNNNPATIRNILQDLVNNTQQGQQVQFGSLSPQIQGGAILAANGIASTNNTTVTIGTIVNINKGTFIPIIK